MSPSLRIAIPLAAFLTVPLPAQPADFSAVERSAAAELARLHIPGASIAIVRDQSVIYTKAFGIANVETGEAVRPEMLFRLGSTTKMFTAAALLGLAAERRIDLHAPLGTYLKFLPPKLSRITADQILSHTAGLRDEAPMYGSHDDSALGDGIRAWTDDWLFTSPGKIFSYSNPGYWLAGYLVETLSGKPYADAMEARLFKPLGMTRTTLRPTLAMTWPLAQGHEYAGEKFTIARPAADNASGWPAGSIFSNTQNLARFAIAFMNQGRVDGTQVLAPEVITLMSTPHAIPPGEPAEAYCYGLGSRQFRGVRVLEHDGSRMGYGSEIRMLPAQRVAIIVQTNRSGATLPATMEAATALLVPLKPPAAPIDDKSPPLAAEDISRIAGVYQNGAQRIEIAARDNRLFVKRGAGAQVELTRRGESLFSAADTRFVIVKGPGGRSEYVFSGGRSFARVP